LVANPNDHGGNEEQDENADAEQIAERLFHSHLRYWLLSLKVKFYRILRYFAKRQSNCLARLLGYQKDSSHVQATFAHIFLSIIVIDSSQLSKVIVHSFILWTIQNEWVLASSKIISGLYKFWQPTNTKLLIDKVIKSQIFFIEIYEEMKLIYSIPL